MIIHRLSYTDRFECMFAAFVDRVCAFRIRQYRLSLLRSTTLRVSMLPWKLFTRRLQLWCPPNDGEFVHGFCFRPGGRYRAVRYKLSEKRCCQKGCCFALAINACDVLYCARPAAGAIQIRTRVNFLRTMLFIDFRRLVDNLRC